HPIRRTLEAFYPPEAVMHFDAGSAERLGDCGRDLRFFSRQDPFTGLEELHAGSERIEHRSHLGARCPGADNDDRLRYGGERPSVAMRRGDVETGDRQSAADAAGAKDDPFATKPSL